MEECDFNAMWDMDDACLNTGMHDIPTSVMSEEDLDRIVKCAEEGYCPVEEISDMIRGMYPIFFSNCCTMAGRFRRLYLTLTFRP